MLIFYFLSKGKEDELSSWSLFILPPPTSFESFLTSFFPSQFLINDDDAALFMREEMQSMMI